jgi:hypothetical protein
LGELIDSSVFIAAERGDPPLQAALALKRPYEDCFLSAVTVGELLHGVYRAKDQITRNRREAWVEGILGEIPVLPYDEKPRRHPAEPTRSSVWWRRRRIWARSWTPGLRRVWPGWSRTGSNRIKGVGPNATQRSGPESCRPTYAAGYQSES